MKTIQEKMASAKKIHDGLKEEIAKARAEDDLHKRNVLMRELQYWHGYLSALEEILKEADEN